MQCFNTWYRRTAILLLRTTLLLLLPFALSIENRWNERLCPWPEVLKAFFTRLCKLLAVIALIFLLTSRIDVRRALLGFFRLRPLEVGVSGRSALRLLLLRRSSSRRITMDTSPLVLCRMIFECNW